MVAEVCGCHGGGACDWGGTIGLAINGGGMRGLMWPTVETLCDMSGGGRVGGGMLHGGAYQ